MAGGGFSLPRPYAADLRARALRAGERGRLSRARIAALFGADGTTLDRWQQQARQEGRRGAKPHAGGPAPRLDGKALDVRRRPVAEANASTPVAYADRLAERAGVRVSGPTLCHTLERLGLVREKPAARPSRTGPTSSPSARRGAGLAAVDPSRLVFLEESGIGTRLTRTRARAARGPRALGAVPWGPWQRLTVLGAPFEAAAAASIRQADRIDAFGIDGPGRGGGLHERRRRGPHAACRTGWAAATSTAVLKAFVEQVLAPALRERPVAIVVMDNLAAHQAEEGAGRRWDRLPLPARPLAGSRPIGRSAPDPIPPGPPPHGGGGEPCWAKLKTRLRAKAARTIDALEPSSARRWPPSPPRTPKAGSASAAT